MHALSRLEIKLVNISIRRGNDNVLHVIVGRVIAGDSDGCRVELVEVILMDALSRFEIELVHASVLGGDNDMLCVVILRVISPGRGHEKAGWSSRDNQVAKADSRRGCDEGQNQYARSEARVSDCLAAPSGDRCRHTALMHNGSSHSFPSAQTTERLPSE